MVSPVVHHTDVASQLFCSMAVCIRACERCSACDVRLTEGEMPLEREDDWRRLSLPGQQTELIRLHADTLLPVYRTTFCWRVNI